MDAHKKSVVIISFASHLIGPFHHKYHHISSSDYLSFEYRGIQIICTTNLSPTH